MNNPLTTTQILLTLTAAIIFAACDSAIPTAQPPSTHEILTPRHFFKAAKNRITLSEQFYWEIDTVSTTVSINQQLPMYKTRIEVPMFSFSGQSIYDDGRWTLCDSIGCDVFFVPNDTILHVETAGMHTKLLLSKAKVEVYYKEIIGGPSHSPYSNVSLWIIDRDYGIRGIAYLNKSDCEVEQSIGQTGIITEYLDEICDRVAIIKSEQPYLYEWYRNEKNDHFYRSE